MSFLNPAALWFLPLSLFPLLLHLLSLRRARKVLFSDLIFLRKAYERARPRSRLQEWLLVLARCLLIFFIVAGFSRPLLRLGSPSYFVSQPEEQGLDLVLLVDVSYSMDYYSRGKSRLERVAALAENLLKDLKAQDRASVFFFSDRIEGHSGELGSNFEKISVFARKASIVYRPTDYRVALDSAYELLSRSSKPRKAVLVLSDNAAAGAKTLGKNLKEQISFYDPAVLLAGVKWQDEPENAWAHQVQAAAQPEKARIAAELRYRGRGKRSTSASFWTGERLSGKKDLELSPGRESWTLWEQGGLPANEAYFAGKAGLREDSLSADDQFFFSSPVSKPERLLCVEGLPGSGYFLKQVLALKKPDLPRLYECDFLDSSRFENLPLQGYRGVLWINHPGPSDSAAAKLKDFVRKGGGLWVILGGQASAEGYRKLFEALPASFPEKPLTTSQDGMEPSPESLPDPRVWKFSWQDFELQKVEFRRIFPLNVFPQSKVLFHHLSRLPLQAIHRYGAGRVMIWASSWEPSWSNIALKPVFASWLHWSLGLLTERDFEEGLSLKIGEPVVRRFGPEEEVPDSIEVRTPDGKKLSVRVHGREAGFYETFRPGLYWAQGVPYAVNLDVGSMESDLTFAQALPWSLLREEYFLQDWNGFVYGKEVRGAFMALGFLLILAEMWLSKAKTKPI